MFTTPHTTRKRFKFAFHSQEVLLRGKVIFLLKLNSSFKRNSVLILNGISEVLLLKSKTSADP